MKKYLLSLLCISGAILAMADPTPMAGPTGDYATTLKKAFGLNYEPEIQASTKQGDKTIIAIMADPISPAVARFNADGSIDTTFGIRGRVYAGPGYPVSNQIITGVKILPNNNISVSGKATSLDDGKVTLYTFEVTSTGKVIE